MGEGNRRMITGKVLGSGEAVITVVVRRPGGQMARIQAMVDTGFNDELTLPAWVIQKLGLVFDHESSYTLADGMKSVTRIFGGEVEWHGAWREIQVAEIESDPLVGMVMLRGSHLGIDVVEEGRVEIRPMGA